jgi:DUF4097 and DUF4098 domain-containing protein YvlB
MLRKILPAAALVPIAFGQINLRDNRDTELSCGRINYCEMREETVASSSQFSIEGLHNGSVTVLGTNRSDVRVRMRVEVGSSNEKDAKALFGRIHPHVSPGRFTVDGPDLNTGSIFGWNNSNWWSVSVEVFVPHRTDLRVETHNGAIKIADIGGRIDSRSHNGATRIDRVTGAANIISHNGALNFSEIGGDVTFESYNGGVDGRHLLAGVSGSSHNGGVEIELDGMASPSRSVDLESQNGRVSLGLPQSYSAHVRTQSHNGKLSSDFPITVRGRTSSRDNDNDQDFDIGSGSGSIRIRTHNGGIRLARL